MLENALELGEDPEQLIIYASLGKAARDWASFAKIVELIKCLRDDETLVLQSGRPIGVFPTSSASPMIVSACSNFVGQWQKPERFYELAAEGLTMWGGLTAGAWQYIGFQGVLQGTYELLRRVGAEHFGGVVDGRWLLTSGLGGMGSSQPLAASMAGLSSLTIEIDPAKVTRSQKRGLLHKVASSLGLAAELFERYAAGVMV